MSVNSSVDVDQLIRDAAKKKALSRAPVPPPVQLPAPAPAPAPAPQSVEAGRNTQPVEPELEISPDDSPRVRELKTELIRVKQEEEESRKNWTPTEEMRALHHQNTLLKWSVLVLFIGCLAGIGYAVWNIFFVKAVAP